MGKKTPKQSPKKQPASASTGVVAETKPASVQASKPPAAKVSKDKGCRPKNSSRSSKMGSSTLTGSNAKKENKDERLARQKSAREALLEQGSHDNIEVITAGVRKVSIKRKPKERKEGDEGEDVEEEEEEEGPPVWDYEDALADLILFLESQGFVAEHDKATETCALLEGILLEEDTWKTTRELLDRVMTVNAELAVKVAHETTPRCVIYRLRKLIIDEFKSITEGVRDYSIPRTAESFFLDVTIGCQIVPPDNFDIPDVPEGMDPVTVGAKVKQGLIAAIEEYKTELENIPSLIAAYGKDLISEGDYVLTHSFCPTTAKLFLNAAEKCNFTLYVMESAPLTYGYLLIDELEESGTTGIDVILIPDVNVSAMMPKISKVIMPCQAVLRNGDCKTLSFGCMVALEAAACNVDVYCVAASYQLTPGVVPNVNLLLDPSTLGDDSNCKTPLEAHKFDTTDSADVTSIVSNGAMFPASHAQRQMTELYTPRREKDDLLALSLLVGPK